MGTVALRLPIQWGLFRYFALRFNSVKRNENASRDFRPDGHLPSIPEKRARRYSLDTIRAPLLITGHVISATARSFDRLAHSKVSMRGHYVPQDPSFELRSPLYSSCAT